jgi:hypothetical protein
VRSRREFITLLGSAAAAWPLAARAQQGDKVRRIGVLAAHKRHVPEFDGFREQLRELAYVEGKNLVIDWRRYAAQGTGELPILAKQLVDLHPDVIIFDHHASDGRGEGGDGQHSHHIRECRRSGGNRHAGTGARNFFHEPVKTKYGQLA